jgi:DNA mismatch repair protein MSH6
MSIATEPIEHKLDLFLFTFEPPMSLLNYFSKKPKTSQESVSVPTATTKETLDVDADADTDNGVLSKGTNVDNGGGDDNDDDGDDDDNDDVGDDDADNDASANRKRKAPVAASRSAATGGGALNAAEKERKAKLDAAKRENAKEKGLRQRYAFLDDPQDDAGRRRGDVGYDKTTLLIPMSAWANMTEFEKSFWSVKRKHFDCVVFFKKGKFYELFESDADLGASLLGLKVSQRGNMRLAGVPINYFNAWAKKLLDLGHKIGRVDEVETKVALAKRKSAGDAVGDKSVMQRELVQILTPSTIVDEELLTTQYENHLLALVEWQRAAGADSDSAPELQFGICYVDASIGKFHIAHVADDSRRLSLQTLLQRAAPKEVLHYGLSSGSQTLVQSCLKGVQLVRADRAHLHNAGEFQAGDGAARGAGDAAAAAAAASTVPGARVPAPQAFDANAGDSSCARWLREWCGSARVPAMASSLAADALLLAVSYLRHCMLDPQLVERADYELIDAALLAGATATGEVQLDGQTIANLELLQNSNDGQRAGSLLDMLDDTKTAFGKRLLPRWVTAPLAQLAAIVERQATVRDLMGNGELATTLARALGKLPDLERLLARVKNRTMTAKELGTFVDGLSSAGVVWRTLADEAKGGAVLRSALLQSLADAPGSPLAPIVADMVAQFDADVLKKEGLLVPHDGVDADYDACRAVVAALQEQLDGVRDRARVALNCTTVTFGDVATSKFDLQVPVAALKGRALPADFKETSSNKQVTRFRTAELERLVQQFEEATDALKLVQAGALTRQLQRIVVHAPIVTGVTGLLARLDCLLSLASACKRNGWSCVPELVDSRTQPFLQLRVSESSHALLGGSGGFVTNDIELGSDAHAQRVVLLTGPNMGGKSTVMRQACLLVLLAQIGCCVPARSYRATVVDRIFTRIGAQDNILAHQSTFMCELQETSTILRHATAHSLVVMDELGRGTSTFDGLAIAWAVLVHLADTTQCGAFFSTHYHQLTRDAMRERAHSIRCMHMDATVDAAHQRVTFLYRLVDGTCPHSYGMNVATMADVPAPIVAQAEEISGQMETLFEFAKLAAET